MGGEAREQVEQRAAAARVPQPPSLALLEIQHQVVAVGQQVAGEHAMHVGRRDRRGREGGDFMESLLSRRWARSSPPSSGEHDDRARLANPSAAAHPLDEQLLERRHVAHADLEQEGEVSRDVMTFLHFVELADERQEGGSCRGCSMNTSTNAVIAAPTALASTTRPCGG